MEGPSLLILKEELIRFKGKRITAATGSAKINYEGLIDNKLKSVKTWGKHLLLEFNRFSLRIHFLMFGSYRINEEKNNNPRLHLEFESGDVLNFYTTAVTVIDEKLDHVYDWTADVLNKYWDAKKARRKLKSVTDINVGDALLDQNIFAGVGNIIKNEVLFRIEVHPDSTVGALPPRKLTQLITQAREYSFDFLRWKRIYQLKKHWLIYTRRKCPRCSIAVIKAYTGKGKRRTFYCANCQKLYK